MIEKITTGSFLTNTYVISNGRDCVIVDPGLDFDDHAKQIKQNYNVQAIFLTHGHMDHIDGIQYFKEVPIYLHELEMEFLSDPSLSLYRLFGTKIPFKKEDFQLIPVHDQMEFDLIGYTFRVLHTPGHTRGSVVYSYNDKLLSGDTLFHMSMGRTDFPTGDSIKMKNSLKKLISTFKDTVHVYPGHDEKTTIGFERKNNPFV